MRILLLGGTAWLGHTIAEAAVTSGHEVTCLARGTDVPKGVNLVRADRDEDHGLSPVTHDTWDAVIDVASQPGYVRRSVRDLAAFADQYVYISSCNAYASLAEDGIAETAPLNTPLVAGVMASTEEYGEAKVACEDAVLAAFGPKRTIIIRPGLIGGPGDPTGRTSYWPLRLANPSTPDGRVLVPEASDQLTSVIDVRDLAAWIIHLLEHSIRGIFNAAGDPVLLNHHLDIARTITHHQGKLVPASSDWLIANGVAQWSGPRSLPLWVTDAEARGIGALSNSSAKNAGLRLRPLAKTLADTLAWATAHNIVTVNGAGLSDEEETSLVSRLDAQ
ncbi:NAD-dependent epimerase/dehydratase family protein [Leucobacter coleopterorum]|uniref:NAD-dependent epimerase/dehydratase family protein n=1 Tax=Leucobacter coleopterorum TaxID=2714933 RepID=A0ABX6JWE1_9MICO|nr:NAD-dependent epimerase/dehydratase family protein [Leucobacter coleopterorum]QIM18626.1 NAD-dependent epimerase/dehydratase family protein [Leucobacter coleopterorum]